MTDLATLAIKIDSGPAKAGADVAVQSAERIKTAFTTLSPVQERAVQNYERLRQELRRGAIGHDEYLRKQSELLAVLQKSGAASTPAARATQQVAQATFTSATAAESAATQWSKLQRPLQAAALGLAGIPGPAGRAATAVGMMATSGGVVLAVTAGIALVTAAWDRYTKAAREAKASTDALIAAAQDVRVDERTLVLQRLGAAQGALGRAEADLQRLLREGGGFIGQPYLEAKQRVTDLTVAVEKYGLEYNRIMKEIRDREQREGAQAAAEAARLADQRARAVEDAVQREADARRKLWEETRRQEGRTQALVRGQVAALQGRTAARGDRQFAAGMDAVERNIAAFFAAVDQGAAATKAAIEAQRERIQLEEQTRLAAVALLRDSGALPRVFTDVAEIMVRFTARLKELKASGESAAAAIALMLGQLANAVITGRGPGASAARGGIGGAASGAMIGSVIPGVGTAIGAVVGGVLGTIGGFLSGKKQEKQDRAAFRGAESDFVARATGSPIEQQLAALGKEFRALEVEAKRLGLSTSRIRAAYYQQRLELLAQQERERRWAGEELEIRARRLEGQTAEAETRALALQQEQERVAATSKKLDAASYATLIYIQALEQEQLLKDQAARAIEERAAQEQRAFSLAEREARLTGQTGTADRSAIAARAAQELAGIEADLVAGRITEAEAVRWITVITGERTQALHELAEAEAAAAAAEAQRAQRAMEDLNLRELVARGQDATAEAYRHELDQQRELEQALADGMSTSYLARLQYVQGLEDEAFAQAQAAAAADQAAQAIADAAARVLQETRALEDLQVRGLRAGGQDDAADIIQQAITQQRELQDAVDAGMSQGFLDQLRQVQQAETAAQDQARRQRQQDALSRAMDQNFGLSTPFPESRTTTSYAIGASESTVGQLAGLNRSQLLVQQEMAASLIELVRLARIGARVTGASTVSIDLIDAGLGKINTDASSAAGVQPGNV